MKVLIVTGTRVNLGGGMEYFFKNLSKFLKDRHKITVIESVSGPEYVDLKSDYTDAKIISLGNKSGFDLPSLGDFIRLRRLFLENDVVYYHSGAWNEVYCLFLQFLTGTPVVGMSWFITDSKYRFDNSLKFGQDSARAKFATAFLGPSMIRIGKFFRRYQVVSEEDLQFLTNKWGDKGKVTNIPFGIDTSRYELCQKESSFTVLFLARLDYQKGADRLPELASILDKTIGSYKLLIVGDGILSDTIKRLEDTNENVRWLGYVGKEKMWNKYSHLLCSSHVFISPIRYAGTTIIGLEALASGTPVIEFIATGTRERIVDDYNGYGVKSVQEMADKILQIYKKWNTGNLYVEMVHNSRESVKPFESSEKFLEIEQLLSSAVQKFNRETT